LIPDVDGECNSVLWMRQRYRFPTLSAGRIQIFTNLHVDVEVVEPERTLNFVGSDADLQPSC
jgi:hypothetical protein